MGSKIIPASPNWYCSRVTDSNYRNILVYGARHDVYIFGCVEYPVEYLGVFIGHKEKVTAVCLCDHEEYGSYCCSGSEDGIVKLWNTEDKSVKLEHTMHTHRVTAICWSSQQCDLIVSGDENGMLGVWQIQGNRQAVHRLDKSAIQCMAMSPASAGLVAVGLKSGFIQLVDVKQGNFTVASLKGHDEEVYTLDWCPVSGENFKSAPQTATTDITDLESFGVDDSWRKPKCRELPVATDQQEKTFGEDGWLLASGSKDKTIRIWGTSKGRQLLLLKLPNPARRDRADSGSRTRPWLTLKWLKQNPGRIVSSSLGGDLILWDIQKTGKDRSEIVHATQKGHFRTAFNICPVSGNTNTICTISMDRQIIFWDVNLKHQIGVLPSLGGFVYTAKTSPLDPGSLALGTGDNMIRLWNLRSGHDMTALWQGIRSKVTALCWHPEREGLLAYGTEDGRVGIYNTLNNKPPQISTTYHRRTVYVVAWGPASGSENICGVGMRYHVYSCGDGTILEHVPQQLEQEAGSVTDIICRVNPAHRTGMRAPTRSEVSWSPDFNVLAVGNDDGTVEIYASCTFKLLAVIQTHHKLINVACWHPDITMASVNGSPYKHHVAIASNECHITVVDLSSLFGEARRQEEVVQISQCWRRLEGHSSRVTGLAWSPHTDAHLVSVSYDNKALVWNVSEGVAMACYQGHHGMLLCCQWHGLESSTLITGGQDFTVHVWNLQHHPVKPGQLDMRKKKSRKTKKDSSVAPAQTAAAVPDEGKRMSADDQTELEVLLEQKAAELLRAGQDGGQTEHPADKTVPESVSRLEKDVKSSGHKDSPSMTGKKTDKTDGKKRYKVRSMFPELSKMENRGKQFILNDLVTLAKLVFEGKGTVGPDEDFTHLGLFLDRRAAYATLAIECEYHWHNENMDYFYQLEVWKGNITGALRVARQRDELTDWLVAMAPMASFDTWTSVCEDYSVQLESDGQYHKAATYLLASNKVYDAIRLFKRHKLFKEAIALAKVRLSPLDPALEELYTLWAQQLTKDGNYEQAAKCHLAMKQVQDAAKLLARRYDQSSLRTAAHISMIGNDRQQGLMYTQRVVNQHLENSQWAEAYSFLHDQKDQQVYLACSSLHEMVCCELHQLGLLTLHQPVFTEWLQQQTKKTPLPEFILDPGDVDSLSPWQLHLIVGHTFPHHVLRTWYTHFDIAMDTLSIEDMYKTLCLLHAGRQSQAQLPQIVVQVCTDLTLCMLSLMMSETPTAMSHLLQAVGCLHEAALPHLMQGLLRLFLPQGPKYILKLQQEVTAMRVLISMDTHSHVDGASKVHSIKRYLSEHKDDTAVNTSSMRCRELDSLRAYYYVAILNFLKDSCHSGERREYSREISDATGYVPPDPINNVSNAPGSSPGKLNQCTEIKGTTAENCHADRNTHQSIQPDSALDVDINENGKPTSELNLDMANTKDLPMNNDSVKENLSSEKTDMDVNGSCSEFSTSDKGELLSNLDSIESKSDSRASSMESSGETSVQDKERTVCRDKPTAVPSPSPHKVKDMSPTSSALLEILSSVPASSTSKASPSPVIPVFNVNHYSITVARLAQISQGLLWDLQAKRFALTETLGYIHKAISHLLLSKNSQSTDSSTVPDDEATTEDKDSNQESNDIELDEKKDNSFNNSSGETIAAVDRGTEIVGSAADGNTMNQDTVVITSTEKSCNSAESPAGSSSVPMSQEGEGHLCELHRHCHEGPMEDHICHSLLSHHFDQMLNIHIPHVGEVPVLDCHGESRPEAPHAMFEVCSSCELLHKSRKILFDDEPRLHSRPDVGFKDITNITNPAKYINVPDEWYGMPVDQKYFKRYVTMAILKEEQEYVMTELKKGPDGTQSPFPNPLVSVKPLLDLAVHSSHISTVERQEFVQKVITWALNFAVTTQQKQTLVNLLQTHLEK